MPGKYELLMKLAVDAAGNRQGALDKLLGVYEKALTGYIRSNNLLNDADSEDIYQETTVGIWQGIGGYTAEKGSFLEYLLAFADTAVDGYYEMSARDNDEEELYDTPLEELPDDEENEEDGGEDDGSGSKPKVATEAAETFPELAPELKGTPDGVVINSPYLYEKYTLLLKTLMGETEPVHQALLYAVTKLAAGAGKNLKGLEYEDVRDKTLFELLLLFKREFSLRSGIPDVYTDDEVMLMFDKLNAPAEGLKPGVRKLEDLMDAEAAAGAGRVDRDVHWKIHEYMDEKFIDLFKV